MVLITKQQKRMAYAYLLEEGVIVIKKDVHLKKHQVLDMPNLNLICILRTLTSKKYVNEIFSWNWYYYTVTKEGVKFLCQYLGVSEQVLPKTFKAPPKKAGEEEPAREERRGFGERRGRGRGARARGGMGMRGYRRDAVAEPEAVAAQPTEMESHQVKRAP